MASISDIATGAGTVLDLNPRPVHWIDTKLPQGSDTDSLRDDWVRVGRDLSEAIDRVKEEVSQPQERESVHQA